MRGKIFNEELIFLKESELADKHFFIFQNRKGELRAVEKSQFTFSELNPGDAVTAVIHHKGCAGREIQEFIKN